MAGAGARTARVTVVNANYEAADAGSPGAFTFLLVTEDGERHELPVTADDAVALLALVRAEPVLLWDPDARTLVAANLLGEWVPPDWSAADRGGS